MPVDNYAVGANWHDQRHLRTVGPSAAAARIRRRAGDIKAHRDETNVDLPTATPDHRLAL